MDYTQLAETVSNLIGNYSDLVITYTTKPTGYTKTYNPSTSSYTWYLSGNEVNEPTMVTHKGVCLQTTISDYFKAKGYVQENDSIFLVSGIPKPAIGSTVSIDGTEHTVVKVNEVKPSTVSLLYKLVVRR